MKRVASPQPFAARDIGKQTRRSPRKFLDKRYKFAPPRQLASRQVQLSSHGTTSDFALFKFSQRSGLYIRSVTIKTSVNRRESSSEKFPLIRPNGKWTSGGRYRVGTRASHRILSREASRGARSRVRFIVPWKKKTRGRMARSRGGNPRPEI